MTTEPPPATADTRRAPSAAADPAPELTLPTAAAGVEPLARALRAMATELERDPALAQRVADAMQPSGASARPGAPPIGEADAVRAGAATLATEATDDTAAAPPMPTTRVNRSFHPRIITGTPPELGAGVPDPFALAARLGMAGLRVALAELRLGSLRAIVREQRLDPEGRLIGQNDPAKLRALILDAVQSKGDAHAITAGASAFSGPGQTKRTGRSAKMGQQA